MRAAILILSLAIIGFVIAVSPGQTIRPIPTNHQPCESAQDTFRNGCYATARLIGEMGNGHRSIASCVIVEYRSDTGMAVACAHQAREEYAWSVWPVGHEHRYRAELVCRTRHDGNADISVFRFRPTEPVSVATLAQGNPSPGTPVQIRGFPLGVTRQLAKRRQISNYGRDTVWMNGIAQQGDSGGAVLSELTGELVGIVSATSSYDSVATHVETIRKILTQHTQWGRSSGGVSSPPTMGSSPEIITPRQSPQQRTPIQRPDCPQRPPTCQGKDGADGKDGESFIDWFTRVEGDKNGDGKVDKLDVAIAYRGLDGANGKDGQDGVPGAPGEGPTTAEILAMIKANMPELPPTRIQYLDAAGNVVEERTYAIGEPITIDPLIVRTYTTDGKEFSRESYPYPWGIKIQPLIVKIPAE